MSQETEDPGQRAALRVAEVGVAMSTQISELTSVLYRHLADVIEPLQGEQPLLDLLYTSIESNLETLAHIVRHGIPIEEVSSPAAAEQYARRLAQRGISSTALIRAYRLGQQLIVDWAFEELHRRESDPLVALAAVRQYTDLTFRYIDSISEQVVHEYEAERERWLSNRNTVRAAMLDELVRGDHVDLASAEQALGYRLRQYHLGVLLWSADETSTGLPALERLLGDLAAIAGSEGQPLFFPRDRSTAWGWAPLGRSWDSGEVTAGEIELNRGRTFAAFGTPGNGPAGFRVTHLEARRAQQVAITAGDRARRLTSYDDPEVRTAAMLAADPEETRRLVAHALGPLASDSEPAERLRETLLAFLAEGGSYVATAARIHLHKNTVRYRIDKAIEERGRPLDDGRLELELALIACRWLGETVLDKPCR